MSDSEDRINVTRDLPDYPAVYEGIAQTNTARQFAKRLNKKIRLNKKLSTNDWIWKNTYDKVVRGTDDEEQDEEEKNEDSKDAYILLMDKVEDLTENYEKRLAKMREDHQKQLDAKDKRIDDILAKHNEERDKDFSKLVGMISTASKEGAENANKHLTQSITATNSLNHTLLSTMQTQWSNVGEFSKKQFKELSKLLEDKEKEEPGFFESFFNEVIVPNQDKIGNSLKQLFAKYLPAQ